MFLVIVWTPQQLEALSNLLSSEQKEIARIVIVVFFAICGLLSVPRLIRMVSNLSEKEL